MHAGKMEVVRPDTRLSVGDVVRVVSFAVGGGWKYLSQTDSNAVVILRRGPDGSAIGVYFQSAIPGSTIEEATVRWMTLMLTEPTVFEVTDVPTPIVASEEEASFMLYGLDGKSKMVSKCRIKLLGDARSDYWALVFSVSPDDLQLEAFAEVDGIADSLKLEPPQAP
jgi:hypothetical protein